METTQVNHAFLRGWLLLLVGILMPLTAMADEVTVADSNGNELRYTYDSADGPATFIGIKTYSADADKAGRIVIASSVKDEGGNSHKVQTINGSLNNRSKLVTVYIPTTVTTIGASAFSSISTLVMVTFAEGSELTSLGESAFRYNNSLESINIEACTKLTAWPNSWLSSCQSLKSLTVPASVTEFGSWMFDYTNNIETITFLAPSVPNNFYSGSGRKLTTLNIGAGVKSIGENAFSNIKALKTVNIDAGVSDLNIMQSAFYNSDGMKMITLPAGVSTLGNSVFSSCDSLETVMFAEGSQLTSLGESAFRYDKSLESINIEACTKLTAWPNSWLSSCQSLKSLTVPASVTEFGSWMFDYTNNIETITFLAPSVPNNFYSGSGRKLTTLNIGAGVKSIGENAFSNIKALKTVNIDAGVSDLNIMQSAFYNSDGMKMITLPAGVSTLGNSVFSSCDSLVTVTFATGSTLKTIPNSAFSDCKSIETITIPDAVETVESSAFYNCKALTEVTFGTGLKTLASSWVFDYSPVKKIVLPGPQNPFTGWAGLSDDVTLWVHPDLVEAYHSHDVTKNFHIMAIGQTTDFAVTTTVGGQLEAQVAAIGDANNVLTLTVTGPLNGTDIDFIHSSMPNIEVLNLTNASIVEGGDSYHQWNVNSGGIATIETYYGPWNTENNVISRCMFYNMPRLRSLSLPKGVTKIGDYAFGQDRNQNLSLKHIDLPTGVTEIGRNAFEWTGIEILTVPAAVTRLEQYTFSNCRNLKKVVLPDDITFIGYAAFNDCRAMEDVNIPNKVETIDQYAFYNNNVRTTPIVLPATLKSIGYRAFMYNSKVESITFNEGLEAIRSYAFSNCNAVKAISLPESITTLENNVFEGCDSITEFRFPANIKKVPDGILYHCDKLQKVVLTEGTTRIGHEAFNSCPQLNDINISTMNTLTSTGRYAFANTGFTTMTLPNSITEMDYSAFRSCANLESINVPTLLTTVPYDFVAYCPKLTSVQMHDGIRTVGHNAFYGCRMLATIELNDMITDIEYNAFRDCDSLVVSQIPTALKKIGDNAFNTTNIKSASLPEGMTELGTGIFANCKKLATVHLPKDIKRITNYMFQSCSALEQIQIPDSVTEIGYAAFDLSGLTSVVLPDSLEKLESYAFSSTQLRSFRVPDGIKGDQPGSYVAAWCKHLKEAYLGRNQDYTTITSFTYFHNCDSLQLLRIYAGTPPKCSSYYMGYRKNCVLEVPEDAVDLYKETDVWKEFKEIKGYFDGDVLNDLDFAILKSVYNKLDGANWKQPWDLSNNHRSMGKWKGVVTVGDYITSIDLSAQGLKGELPDSLFMLPRIETLNLSNNHIKGDLTTLLANRSENSTLTEVNMMGNELTGDIYPFASKLPNLTKLNVSYNQLTAVSQPISREKLRNEYFYRGFQFVDYQTKQIVEGAPVTDITLGVPVDMEFNTLQTYRHEYGDYGYDCSDLYRHYLNKNGDWSESGWELTRNSDKLWTLYTGSSNRPLKAPKGVPVMYTHGDPWWSHLSFIVRFDWKDGDVNADQTIDVTDLQSVVYYALNDNKVNGQMFNFTTADANNDDKINVSDIVGSVDYVLAYEETTPAQVPYYYNRAPASQQNTLGWDGNNIVLTHADAVAALQLTVTGAAMGQLHVSDALKSQFSVAMREVADGVRLVVWSADGHTLMPGVHQLLNDLPAGAVVTDVRLSDAEARHLDVSIEGGTTSLSIINYQLSIDDAPVFDLSGRRLGAWDTLPEGVYVIRVNGKQYKVKK